jgi:hypothetical protein
VEGGVYKPFALIVPLVVLPPATPSTLQLTLKLVVLPVTVAVNCCGCAAATEAVLGDSVTTIAATLRLIDVVGVKLPEVPVTVTVAGPIVAELFALKVNVLALVVGLGLNEAETPLGKDDVTVRFTALLKPLTGRTVIVLVLLLV